MSSEFDYEVLTEEEALGLLPKGDYDAVITKAESRKGSKDPSKNYLVLTVKVKNTFMTTWCALPYMVKHAAESTGNEEKYKNKSLKLSDFIDKKCTVRLKIKPGTDQYPTPKNVVSDFLSKKENKDQNQDFNDDVPF